MLCSVSIEGGGDFPLVTVSAVGILWVLYSSTRYKQCVVLMDGAGR
eukprot:COSAG06_NODE_6127_length_3096_cov_1.695028_2_plen_46_part_00